MTWGNCKKAPEEDEPAGRVGVGNWGMHWGEVVGKMGPEGCLLTITFPE
jgi:hypothetical protein